MDVVEAMVNRKSVRKFKSHPVPRETLRDILATAVHSPSAKNTQPWDITVVTGDAMDKLRNENLSAFLSGTPTKAEISRVPFVDEYKARQVALAVQIFKLMDIGREDKEKRREWEQRGFAFFDAPAVIFLSIDKRLDGSETSLVGIGAIMQNICMAAMNHGLGSCVEDQGVLYPHVIRRHTGLPESKRLAICIAIGYPDADFLGNSIESAREPLENVVTWVE